MREATVREARLLPDGHLTPLGSPPDPEATWQVLGDTQQGGTLMGFVRADLAGVSWTTLVQRTWLERAESEVLVTLARQSSLPKEPLLGWILFC